MSTFGVIVIILLIYFLFFQNGRKKDQLRALPLYVLPGKYEPRYVPSSVN